VNIVKASLLNAVRRKWKFALVVLLFGVGLVVLTNAYDVAGAMERVIEVNEAFQGGGEPTEEQMEQMARGTALTFLFATLALFFGFGTLFFGFVMPGGVVANERRSAAIMLWAQHPMPLTSFYLRRYLGIQIATLAALLVFSLTAAAVNLPSGVAPGPQVGSATGICLEGLLACAISFGITALGIRRAALFGLVYYLPSSLIGQMLTVAETSSSMVAEVARAVLPFAIFPGTEIDNLVDGFESGVAWDWGALGMVVYHFALWTAVAWLGLRRIERRPLKL
jgi:hypothetical protein